MQAVILAAGNGNRLAPHTRELPKPLLPLAGRPIINYVLDGLSAAGVREAVVVVGYRSDRMREALENSGPPELRVRCIDNEDRKSVV